MCVRLSFDAEKNFNVALLFVLYLLVCWYLCCNCRWVVDIAGASGTLYEGEIFKLQFKFGPRYPFDSPEVLETVFCSKKFCLRVVTSRILKNQMLIRKSSLHVNSPF